MIEDNIKQSHNIFDLSNRVIIITGALGLLGQKHVEIVADYGGIPIILDVDEKKVLLAAERVQQKYNVPAGTLYFC